MSTTQDPPPTVGIDDAYGRTVADVRSRLADLVDTPTWSLDDARLDRRISDALAARAAIDEVVSRLVGEADDRNLPHRHGASSTRAHLMTTHRMSAGEASRTVRTARQLHGTSAVTEPTRRAVATGQVSAEQGVVVAEAIHRLSPRVEPDRVDVAQADLIGHAQTLSFTQLQVAANHLVEVVDPDTADQLLEKQLREQERQAWAATEFTGQYGADGIARGRYAMPNLTFAMLKKHLDALASPRRAATGTSDEAPADPLGETTIGDLPYSNRLGQAFCELIEHLPADGHPHHGATNISLVVTVDAEKLRTGAGEATLDTGGAISIGETRRLACNAGLLPMVLSGDSRILDLGTTKRLFDRYQRIALTVRDRGCVFPGCERPPAWTEAHHRIPWSRGGPTDIDQRMPAVQLPPPPHPPRRMGPDPRPRRHHRHTAPSPHRPPAKTHPPPTLQTPNRMM